MKKFTGLLHVQRKDRRTPHNANGHDHSKRRTSEYAQGSPEDVATENVILFCEHGGNNGDEEVLYLPPLVSAAEASPAAAAAACRQIRKLLAMSSTPTMQYQAIMLIRILTDNPGETFTRKIDSKFVDNFHHILKSQRDPSVIQMAIETLSGLQRDKAHWDGIDRLLAMWHKMSKNHPAPRRANIQPFPSTDRPPMPTYPSSHNTNRSSLPPPDELAQRIAEARNSANLLVQFVSSASADELIGGNTELITEFADRCKIAQDSMHRYMNCTDPAPDEDTFQTMIETSELLSGAVTTHQRALLAARRELGGASPPVVSSTMMSAPVLSVEARERQQWEEEQEASGSSRLTEMEQLRRLNVRDEDGDSVTENPFADAHGGYGGFVTDPHAHRDKGKQAFEAIQPPNIAELPIPSPQQHAAPSTNASGDYGFPQIANETQFSPPPPPAATKPRRPPPPSMTETEILSNAYRPITETQSNDYPPVPPMNYAAPPIDRAELPASPSRKVPTTVPAEADVWNDTRSHWSAVSQSAARQSQPHAQSSRYAEQNHNQYQDQNRGYDVDNNYGIHASADGMSTTMHGAIGTNDAGYTSQSRSTPQRRAPDVPQGQQLTRENLAAVESASEGSDTEKENGSSKRAAAQRPNGYGAGWGEQSYVHNEGRNRKVRDV